MIGARPSRRARTPTVLQMEALECGAAALASVLAHYGRVVPLEELRLACGVSRDGSKAINILKAARSYGLAAHASKQEPEHLRGQPLPVIVYWEFSHFLVVEGFDNKHVYLNDPASGPRRVSHAEFDQSFTGVVLRFEPGPDFVKGGQLPSLWSGLRSRLHGSLAPLAFVIAAGLLLVVPGLAVPAFTRTFVDKYLVGDLAGWLRPLLGAMLLAAVLLAALSWLLQHHLTRLTNRLTISASARYFAHVLQLPVGFFSMRFAGDVAFRAQLNQRVAQLLSGELATNAVGVLTIVFYAAVMLRYDVLLSAVGFSVAVLNFVALKLISRRRMDANRRLLKDRGNLASASYGGLQAIETLKASGAESDFFARWSGYHAKVLNAEQELDLLTRYLLAVPPLLTGLAAAAILGLGSERIVAGALSIGSLVAFQTLTASFNDPVNRLVSLGGSVQEVEGSMTRLDDVLRYPVDPTIQAALEVGDGHDSAAGSKLAGAIEIRELTFGYSALEPPLIDGLSLSLRPGARVALVGGSGSGKSTVARLVSGLLQPWSGEVLFDGRPRTAYHRLTLSASIAAVDQDIFLFEGSVTDNLTLWDSSIPESEYVRAARDAAIHDDIAARPGAYASKVAEAGANFSGGQRQRLEIARALATNPSILVLDEATSALDATTEQLIDANLRRRGCTCLIVAHRLSTIRDCDEIIVLDRGKVVERGAHAGMSRAGGPYAQLIAAA